MDKKQQIELESLVRQYAWDEVDMADIVNYVKELLQRAYQDGADSEIFLRNV